jgi:hypothetical protein
MKESTLYTEGIHERPHQSLKYRTPAEVYRGPGEARGESRKAESKTKKSGSVV